MLLSFTGFSAQCSALENNVLRLHVIANSDTDADQAVKLKVRDAVLREAQRWYGSVEGFDEALAAVCTHLESLETPRTTCSRRRACRTGDGRGLRDVFPDTYLRRRQPARRKIPHAAHFPRRGGGEELVCVVFPALCVPGASDVGDLPAGTEEVVTDAERFEVKIQGSGAFQRSACAF